MRLTGNVVKSGRTCDELQSHPSFSCHGPASFFFICFYVVRVHQLSTTGKACQKAAAAFVQKTKKMALKRKTVLSQYFSVGMRLPKAKMDMCYKQNLLLKYSSHAMVQTPSFTTAGKMQCCDRQLYTPHVQSMLVHLLYLSSIHSKY